MKRIACVLFLVLWCAEIVWAAGATGPYKAKPNSAQRITWVAMSTVDNSTAYSNENNKSEWVECTGVTVGSNTMSIWLQKSSNGAAFTNASSNSMDLRGANTDSLQWTGRIAGGDQWRLHTEDTDVDVTTWEQAKTR